MKSKEKKVASILADDDTTMSTDSQESSGVALDQSIRNTLNETGDAGWMALCRGNPLTLRGKRVQMAKMMILTLVPICALTVICIVDLATIYAENRGQYDIRDNIRFSTEIGTVVHYLQKERDMTALHLSTMGAETRIFLRERYPDTDKALDKLSKWPEKTSGTISQFGSAKDFQTFIKRHRDKLEPGETDTFAEIKFYSDAIKIFIDWIYAFIQESSDGDQWRNLVAYQLLVLSKEDMGVERTLGGVFYSKGSFEKYSDYLWYMSKHNTGIGRFKAAQRFTETVADFFNEEIPKHTKNFTESIRRMRMDISRNNMTGREPSWEMSTFWFDNMTIYIDIMFQVQVKMADVILQSLEVSLTRDLKEMSVSISLFALVALICPAVITFVRAIMNDTQKYALNLADQTKALAKERRRTDSLLYQMIPKMVAKQLKKGQHVSAESYNECTIYFSDIVSFTKISADCSPMQVISMLNSLYMCFDDRIDCYDVYKVETIGDAYMVVSGVPKRNGRRHVTEIGTMALDLMHHIGHLEIPHLPGHRMQLRAGLHSGPCVAGVVGSKMPRYCLFGDTVNMASRMESHGLPSKVHISESTRDLLYSESEYTISNRGEVEIKGKGKMRTYFLESKANLEELLPCHGGCVVLPLAEMYS
ncbi:uncharacterized protein LOC141908443 [Tubulanus polymorphus]|uniref:uncharacterized protein LOC141908443 n=1 Tax=Tubulanus polymorphus TaxID=672921 RepID=UPI003DA46392